MTEVETMNLFSLCTKLVLSRRRVSRQSSYPFKWYTIINMPISNRIKVSVTTLFNQTQELKSPRIRQATNPNGPSSWEATEPQELHPHGGRSGRKKNTVDIVSYITYTIDVYIFLLPFFHMQHGASETRFYLPRLIQRNFHFRI